MGITCHGEAICEQINASALLGISMFFPSYEEVRLPTPRIDGRFGEGAEQSKERSVAGISQTGGTANDLEEEEETLVFVGINQNESSVVEAEVDGWVDCGSAGRRNAVLCVPLRHGSDPTLASRLGSYHS